MKTLTKLLLLVMILFTVACTKEGIRANTQLTGKWKLTASFADPGDGSGTWQPVTGNAKYAEFKANGKVEGDAFDIYGSYILKDSVTITFTKKSDTTTQNYLYHIKGNELTMSPSGPIMCIEGCGIRFKKED